MTTEKKLITYLRSIANSASLEEAHRDARLALRVAGVDLSKEGQQ